MLEVGHRAPCSTLYDEAGKPSSLETLVSGSAVLLAFFKVSCPVCQLMFPFLERLSSSGLRLIGISQDSVEPTRKFAQRFGVTFPMLYDREDRRFPASNAFGITNVPSLFLIEPDGKISWVSMGFAKRELQRLADRLNAAIFRPGENVPEWKAG